MSNNMEIIDIESWVRKEHFEFFSQMASPFFGLTTEVDCSNAFLQTSNNNQSFFAYYLHKSMLAVNSIEEFRLRIIDGKVARFDTIHAGVTIGRENGTFGFGFINFSEDFEFFDASLRREIEAVKASNGLRLNEDNIRKDLIRHSTIPWSSFTGLLHPTNLDKTESVPKITFGRFSIRDDKKYLPVSIEANHGLVDGLHIAKYLEEFQRQLNL